MNHSQTVRCSLAVLLLIALVGAGENDVRDRVVAGIRKYQASDFSGAAKDFADADLLLPDNAFIQFNRGCAESHDEENRDGAREFFREAAASDETSVATSAHYNLGCLEAREARGLFDGYPEGLSGKERDKAVATLNKAIDHFRDCTRIDPEHTRAKRNIEIIKLFLADARRKWKEQDQKEKLPDQPQEPLVRLLDQIEGDQYRAWETVTNGLEDPVNLSPAVCLSSQVVVNDQIPKLQKTVSTQFQMPTNNEEQKEQLAQVAALFEQQTGELEGYSQAALKSLAEEKLTEAIPKQQKALEPLNRMYQQAAQFPDFVFRSLRVERSILQSTRVNLNASNLGASMIVPLPLLADRQARVATMATLLQKKANLFEQVLQRAEKEQPRGAAAQQGGMDATTIEGYRTAIAKAREFGPELIEVTRAGTELLLSGDEHSAVAKQTWAIEILAEIAKTMPRPPEDDQQQSKDKDNQKNDDQNQPSADEDRGETDPNQQEQQQDQSEQQEQQIRSREEAEKMLRRVRDREQVLRDRKALLRARARRAHVERDW